MGSDKRVHDDVLGRHACAVHTNSSYPKSENALSHGEHGRCLAVIRIRGNGGNNRLNITGIDPKDIKAFNVIGRIHGPTQLDESIFENLRFQLCEPGTDERCRANNEESFPPTGNDDQLVVRKGPSCPCTVEVDGIVIGTGIEISCHEGIGRI